MALNQAFQGGNRVLQGIVSGVANDPKGYMTQRMLPGTPGPHRGTIKVLTGGDHYGSGTDDTLIAPGAEYPKPVNLVFSDIDYSTKKYGKPANVPEEYIDRNELPLDVGDMYLSAATHYLKVMQDYRLATQISGTTWGYNNTPGAGDRWTASGSDPIDQMKTAIDALLVRPNFGAFGYEAFSALMDNEKVIAGMSVNAPHHLADEAYFAEVIARKLGLLKVEVWDTRKRASANPEIALTNANVPRMFAGNVFLGVMSQHPGVAAPNGDLLLQPTAIARVVEEEMRYESAPDFNTDSMRYKVRHKEIVKVVSTSLGALITNAVV